MKIIGQCKLCGNFTKLTFEHIPPAGAFNNSPVYFQDKENLLDKSSYRYGGRKKSNKGAGGYHLCKTCNNNTGSWYARDYIDFAKQGAYVMTNRVYANDFICAEYIIKPLNILKQILLMFVALDTSGYLIQIEGLRSFIQEKNNNDLPSNISVLMYFTGSIGLRMPLSFSNMDGYMRTLGEISYKPFGFHLNLDGPLIDRPYCDITFFSYQEIDELSSVILPLRLLTPKCNFPGIYK